MQGIDAILCDAIQAALWGKIPNVSLYNDLSDQDWYKLYEHAQRQTVDALVYDGLQRVPTAIAIPKMLIMKWSVRVQQIEERNKAMNSIMEEQVNVFRKHGIAPILQKGQGIAQFYPIPNHRNSGDIDWYFETEEAYNKACMIGKEMGRDFSSSAMDAFFRWRGLETELHQRLIESRNPLQWNYIQGLGNKYAASSSSLLIGQTAVKLPAPLLNLLLVNVHILKHQITYGIGLRQFCDAAILYHTLAGQYDQQELKSVYKRLGILAWADVFHQFLVDYIGLAEDKLPYPLKKKVNAEWMLHDVLDGGNFGFHNGQHPDHLATSGRVNRVQRLGNSFFKYVLLAPAETLVFPLFQSWNKLLQIVKKS